MSMKKILAAAAASVVAVSAVSVAASAAFTNYADGYTLDLIAEGYDVTQVYGVTFTISGDYAETGVGGGVGFNSTSTGWASHEWANADAGKELALTEDNKVTLKLDAPAFAESDAADYAQVWVQWWWGGDVSLDSVEVLGADGSVLTPGDAPAADDGAADDDAADDGAADDGAAADDSAAADDGAAASDSAANNVDTGVEGVAAVVGVAAVAAGALIVAKKRK